MEEVPEEKTLKQIRTFQGDVAQALNRQKESLVSIQRSEAAKRVAGADAGKPPARGRSLLFFLGGFVLITLGAVGGWFAYNEFLRQAAPPEVVVPESRFIAVESSVEINAHSLVQEIGSAVQSNPPGQVKHLVLDITTADFLSSSGAPGNLVRALEPVFMLGSLGEKRFIVFKLVSFENAFAGMLAWEETLGEDLGPILSTAPFLKNTGPGAGFTDVVSRNKDARVLFAPAGANSTSTVPVILYSFFDNKMLIITENLDALHAIIDRLTREMLSR